MYRPPHSVPARGGGGGNLGPPYHTAPSENANAGFPYLVTPNPYGCPPPGVPVPRPGIALPPPSYQIPRFPPHHHSPYLRAPLGYRPQVVDAHGSSHSRQELLGRVEAALAKAHQDLLATGESVSAWKVSQSALMALRVDSWASLGFQFQDVPYLRRLVATEGKVNAFIHCFVGVRRITSVYDLDTEICKNEGIEQFDTLGLGPLLQHPLVVHYFSVPSDTSEVPKITTEDIISSLSSYMDKSKKTVVAEEFLNFLTERYAVNTREKLGVRIQSLGMHITHIREAKKAENITLCNSTKELKHAMDEKTRIEGRQPTHPPIVVLEKQVLDRRFGFISKRIKSFSSACDIFEGKHIKFDSSEEDDSGSDSKMYCQSTSQTKNDIQHRVSSCPYPSTTEERERLGLKNQTAEKISSNCKTRHDKRKKFSGRKRKFEAQNINSRPLSIALEEDEVVHTNEIEKRNVHDIVFSSSMMEKFVTIWKEACREHTVVEVLDMMLNFYHSTVKKKKKMRKIFYSYPGVGLLHVAVASMKGGMHESIYEIFQDIEVDGFDNSRSVSPEIIEIETPVKTNEISMKNTDARELKCRVTVDEIIKKITGYFQLVPPVPRGDHPLGNKIAILRTFLDCELWLAREFSVDAFGLLGYGHFVDFLEKNLTLIPIEVHGHFVGDSCRSLLEVNVDQLQVFLSQAQENVVDNGVINQYYISLLLGKQFPSLRLDFVWDKAECHFQELLRKQKDCGSSNYVFYSSTLLGKLFTEKSKTCSRGKSSEILEMTNEAGKDVGSLCPVSAKDAIECLLKVPMLSDLRSWSHWDLVFAPTLGPLLAWLSSEIHDKGLSCIATTDGRLIRIDHSATVDEFLEASIQGSPFHVALKLLSLLVLYGGTNNIPVALLKCYAQRAIDVIVRNSIDSEELEHPTECFLNECSFKRQVVPGNKLDSNPFSADTGGDVGGGLNKGINVAAKFILDCLDHLPTEFHIFAAEILMSGLQSVTKDASLVMLHECKQADQRIMLHDIGLFLGIEEWIEDYHLFNTATTDDSLKSSHDRSKKAIAVFPAFNMDLKAVSVELCCGNPNLLNNLCSDITKPDIHSNTLNEFQNSGFPTECSDERSGDSDGLSNSRDEMIHNATLIIESIRREEFGLDPSSKNTESNLLKKQHARLGRALHCLSQELYSQDSHLLLELVQNADDNSYPETVEPTLVFILQCTGIIVLNNEYGFSAKNIKALCDIGNSTKKGSSAGYIGHKGIGFKSVFRVTDAPEIHSNGFHVRFDISEGQIGFVLPTVIAPCDISLFERQISSEVDQTDASCWKTCIVLPFRSKFKEKSGLSSIMSMFSDLHPSLLLFLHRLQCIKFKNTLCDSLLVMRKEILGDGIVKVCFGTEKMNWLVVRQKLEANIIRPDVQTTEIAVAFTLQESESDTGEYKPYLSLQPVFAFLPLRTYGLKFILQGDFVLPSSREEVDGDSAWNQWLLSEFPALFVKAERDLVALPCFKKFPGKAVTAFMSFVPLVGEVHGFFSYLPHMIVSKLRTSNCLLLEGHGMEWVPPCRVLRGWDDQARSLLSDSLLQQHLGLGYLNRDVALSDSLAKALCIREYGPRILTDIILSICTVDGGIQKVGLDWLCNWFITLNSTMSRHSYGYLTHHAGESDVIGALKGIPLIPLSDGSYGSIAEGPIWLSSDSLSIGFEGKHGSKDFPSLYAKLRMVNPVFLSASSYNYDMEESRVDIILCILQKIGVQQLSAHEVIKRHILPALSDAECTSKDKNLMVEYLSYVMLHFQYACSSCQVERMMIISELRNNSIILTNHGYKCPIKEPVHFSKEFGNPVDINKLIDPEDGKWNEVDGIYLKHCSMQLVSSPLMKWREFFQELGVTDFVQIIHVEKHVEDFLNVVPGSMSCDVDNIAAGSLVNDWESPELILLLSAFSSGKQIEKCRYLLEVLDKMWDECFSSDARNYGRVEAIEGKHPLQPSFLKCLHDFRWIVSSADEELHYPKDIFYDCEVVRSVLGSFAPYAVPQVKSKNFLKDIGFKTQVTLDDALATIQSCGILQGPVLASTVQMSKLYSFIWEGSTVLKMKIMDEFKSRPLIFVPSSNNSRSSNTVPGMFVFSNQVYWDDPTGCFEQANEAMVCSTFTDNSVSITYKTLVAVYPNLHDFFVNECGVLESPPFSSYVQILLQLSSVALPSQAAHLVSIFIYDK
uniref:Sacsin n=1 Tax=Anthurium amnicola TaxID=1678845 RepID=A0A1D1Z6Y8_9ARAE